MENGQPPRLKRRHVAAAVIGNALEFYDFLTYAFFSIQIGHAFFPAHSAYGSLMLSLATFGAGFATRPLGAFVIGSYADRVGRRPAMMLCFILIGCSILGMALIPTYARIGIAAPVLAIAARMMQGFSLGGEIGANTAYLAEAASPANRGFILSWQSVSQYMALIAGGIVGTVLTSVLSPAALDAYGWRIAFLLGAAAIPFGLWLRTNLPETLRGHTTPHAAAAPSRAAQARGHWRILVLGVVVLGAATIGTYISNYTITYAQATLRMPARIGFIASLAAYIASVPAMMIGGYLSDRFGRRPINLSGNLAFLLLIVPVFAWVVDARSAFSLITGMILLGVAANFGSAAILACIVEVLPPAIRGTAFGLVYSVSIAAFGGTTQLVVTWLIHVTGRAMAPAWYLAAATLVGQIGLFLIPESARSEKAGWNEAIPPRPPSTY